MAIINCPECQHEVSDTIETCPHCDLFYDSRILQCMLEKKKT